MSGAGAEPRASGALVADRHLLPTRLGRLHLRTLAPADPAAPLRTPLVLLHLAPQSSHTWQRVAPLLARDRLVVMPDRIGFGHSDHVERAVPFEEYAAATLDALDALGGPGAPGPALERFDVFGAHTGSCEAVELATAHPGRVRRAGVLALPGLSAAEVARFKAEYRPPRPPQLDGSHLLDAWQWWLRWLPAEWGLDLVHRRTLDVLAAEPDAWRAYHAVFDYPFAERLARVAQPFLVLAPRDDLWELTERNLPLCPPGTRVVDRPDVTLESWWRFPELLAGHLRDFLDAA